MGPILENKEGRGLLRIYVQPRSSRNRICGLHGDALKVAITAPPKDGEANKAVTAYLAKFFMVSKKDVSLVSGEQSRTKIVAFNTLEKDEICDRLEGVLLQK